MSHFAFQDRGPIFEHEADYVVVGTGAGGSAAAVTLARGGASVAMVEAGAWRDLNDYPSSAYGAMRDLFDNWGTTIARGRALWPVVQGRAVGGTTVINSAICVRTPGDIFDAWTIAHGIDGKSMAEDVWRIQTRIEAELDVGEIPVSSRGRSTELAILADERLGYDGHVIARYGKGCVGSGQCLQGCRAGKKKSTNLNYIPEVLERGGTVVSCAPVDRIAFEGDRAIGVRGRFLHPATQRKGAQFFLRAKKAVVVSASATHSPALLLRSGVQNPALGEFFRAHPGTGVFGVYDDPVDMNRGVTQGWASTRFRDDPGLKLETLSIPPEMVASRLAGGGTELMKRITEMRHLAMWVHAVRAESVGTMRSGFGGRPVVRYGLDRADMERFRRGLHLVGQAHFAAGARSIIPGVVGLPYKLSADQVGQLLEAPLDPRCYVGILSHLFGGCVMGKDPARAVCDEDGRVHGYRGLAVADASVIPSNLGVNPQHTIMALAARFAERWLDASVQKAA